VGDALRELREETGFRGKISYQKLLAQMYSDDVRNTDTTWIVTSLFLMIADSAYPVAGDGVETAVAEWVPIYKAFTLDFFASHRQMILAAIRYYVVRSFADRGLQGSVSHHRAYIYLREVPDLNLPYTFGNLINITE